jgi:hypothetical protein
MKYAVEMGLGAVIYVPCFIKAGSRIRKLMGGSEIDGHTGRRSRNPSLGNLTIKGP